MESRSGSEIQSITNPVGQNSLSQYPEVISKPLEQDDLIKRFLDEKKVVKTLILMDATGSMGSLINNCKNSISNLFKSICHILVENGLSDETFSIQLACYRSYNSIEPMILQYSTWEQRPAQLKLFMDGLKACEGWAEEAVEIGLQFANQEAESPSHSDYPISQVFVIGDQPPTPPAQVANRRKQQGEAYWSNTRFSVPTNASAECEKLKEKGIEVHTFYIKVSNNVNAIPPAKREFENIAALTDGTSQMLDVNNPATGQKEITDKLAQKILFKIGQEVGGDMGEKLVSAYQAAFSS
ncbi:hypothetical protein FGO68_gene11708 [Halteria grandinella]|uniref:VWFA domain-containing protein n=1 Tax=Halteria grandinella TaxID=5974 RepID=A0A8J8SZR1_HALGN|nr:hypothetical protein FGO68_gene11708 [Halteria grandinella]